MAGAFSSAFSSAFDIAVSTGTCAFSNAFSPAFDVCPVASDRGLRNYPHRGRHRREPFPKALNNRQRIEAFLSELDLAREAKAAAEQAAQKRRLKPKRQQAVVAAVDAAETAIAAAQQVARYADEEALAGLIRLTTALENLSLQGIRQGTALLAMFAEAAARNAQDEEDALLALLLH